MKNQKTIIIENVLVGLTVSFVALSLGAAFGLLSGRGAFSGMISAGVIAIITSVFGGTKVQCSGPTAPMTSIIAVVVAAASLDPYLQEATINPDHFINIVLFMTGFLLMIIAAFRLAKFINMVPHVVISGFMSGIALLIWSDQIQKLFGWGGKKALEGSLLLNVGVTVTTVVLIFILPHIFHKMRNKYLMLIPATLVALVIMTVLSNILNLPIEYIKLSGHLSSFADFKMLISEQWPSNVTMPILLLALPFAVQLAVLCYLDTLLTAMIVDKLTKTKTKSNQELFAQGLGNCAVGFLGGIPGAQATIRSVLMIKENATLRMAGILVGVFTLIQMILFQDWITLIPQAVFTGILIKVGYDVFDFQPIRMYLKGICQNRLRRSPKILFSYDEPYFNVSHREIFIVVGTSLVTVFFNLNLAVGLFTVLFYVFNKILFTQKPMRDLKE